MIRYKKTSCLVAESATCDRCGREMPKDSGEYHERIAISYRGGYDSVFGDENLVECDLCQHCVKELLGPWLRIGGADSATRLPILEREMRLPGALDTPLSEDCTEALDTLVAAMKKSAEDASRTIDEAVAAVEEHVRQRLSEKMGKQSK